MKFLKNVFAVLLLSALAMPAFATAPVNPVEGDLIFEVKVVDNKSVNLQLANLQQLRTEVTITSLNGKTSFFRNTINKHNGFKQVLNLEQMDPGKYLLNVQVGDKTYTKVIRLEESRLLISAGS